MDKRKSMLNVIVSMGFRIVLLVASLLSKRILIQILGNEVNGLYSLYSSIIGVLSVSELGVGSAITFSMYKPIVEGNKPQVAALYQLFRKAYLIIGSVILAAGVCITPLLPLLAKDYSLSDMSLYITFLLMLISVVLTFTFSSKISLINAYKNNYITTAITSTGEVLQHVLQIAVLLMTHSFVAYLLCRIVTVLLQWVATDIITKQKHSDILTYDKQPLDHDLKTSVVKNVKAMFMHKIGAILVNSADSMIISAFIGVAILGKYSNYTTIVTSMTSVIVLFFVPLTSVIGHMYVSEPEQAPSYFRFFYTFNFLIGVIFFLGYYAVIDNLITILFGMNLEMSKSVSFIITINYFLQFLRQSTLLFRDATGTFYHDRWKPLCEGLLNVVLSIAFVMLFTELFGEEIGLVGVIIATIITSLAICHLVEPYVLYKHAFHTSPKPQWLKNYACMALFTAALVLEDALLYTSANEWLELLVNGGISLAISAAIVVAFVALDRNFRTYALSFISRKITK